MDIKSMEVTMENSEIGKLLRGRAFATVLELGRNNLQFEQNRIKIMNDFVNGVNKILTEHENEIGDKDRDALLNIINETKTEIASIEQKLKEE